MNCTLFCMTLSCFVPISLSCFLPSSLCPANFFHTFVFPCFLTFSAIMSFACVLKFNMGLTGHNSLVPCCSSSFSMYRTPCSSTHSFPSSPMPYSPTLTVCPFPVLPPLPVKMTSGVFSCTLLLSTHSMYLGNGRYTLLSEFHNRFCNSQSCLARSCVCCFLPVSLLTNLKVNASHWGF